MTGDVQFHINNNLTLDPFSHSPCWISVLTPTLSVTSPFIRRLPLLLPVSWRETRLTGGARLSTLANDLPVTRLARRARAGRDGIHGERTHDLACYKLVVQLKLANNDKQKEWSALISLISRHVLSVGVGVRVQ